MRHLLSMLLLALVPASSFAQAHTDSLTWRIKAMRCEECAHKVKNALRSDEGVETITFDLERRTVGVVYDTTKTQPDSIMSRLRGTRYKPSAYDPDEIIHRGMGLYMAEMDSLNAAGLLASQLSSMTGIDSVGLNADKHYVFVRYDANRTKKSVIRDALGRMGFTPVSYYTSKNISYAYFNIPEEAATVETIETVLALEGVDDVNVNRNNRSLAITYVNTETSPEQLVKALREEGIIIENSDRQ